MKIPFTSFLLALGVVASASSQAQDTGKQFGVKAGLSMTTLDGQINTNSFYKNGFSAGVMMRIRPSQRLAIQPELLFVRQGAHNEYDKRYDLGSAFGGPYGNYDVKLSYLQLPVMAKVYLGRVFNVQLGPQLGLLLAARRVGEMDKSNGQGLLTVDENVSSDYKALDFALCGGLGVDLPIGLVASLRINYGVMNINANQDEEQVRGNLDLGGLHNRGLELSVGYLLGTRSK